MSATVMAHSNDPFHAGSISIFREDLRRRRFLEVSPPAVVRLFARREATSEDVASPTAK
jgi:hypothetical protein